MNPEFSGKVAVVTGAGQGLGASIANKLAMKGAHLALCDINIEMARKLELQLREAYGVKVISVEVDVSQRIQVEGMRNIIIDSFHEVDILINNAGIAKVCPIHELDEETYDRIMDVNLKSVYLCTKEFLPVMIKKKSGKIVNLSSMSAKIGGRWMTAYSASKAGVMGFTKSLAREVAKFGICVNCVCPGIIPTELWSASRADHAKKLGKTEKEVDAYYASNIPLGRLCTPEDVANVICFLISSEASYMTGQSLNITGGQQME
jgi:NAD(P)-dependent dehydrogenase (short-subunit alcohol dehydrogenase family)